LLEGDEGDELVDDDDDDDSDLEPDVVDNVATLPETQPPPAAPVTPESPATPLELTNGHLREASDKFQSALTQLRGMKARRQIQRARPRPPAAGSPAVPTSQPQVASNRSGNVHVALDALADSEGDGQVARALWDWISARARKLELGGLKGLGTRWSIVLHALGAEATFGRNEWRPR